MASLLHELWKVLLGERITFHVDLVPLTLELLIRQLGDSHHYLESSPVFVFDVLGGAEALELTVDHDAYFRAKSFSFLHGMRREDYCALLSKSRDVGDDRPHESLRLRIYTSAWLIEEYYWRITNQSNRTL